MKTNGYLHEVPNPDQDLSFSHKDALVNTEQINSFNFIAYCTTMKTNKYAGSIPNY